MGQKTRGDILSEKVISDVKPIIFSVKKPFKGTAISELLGGLAIPNLKV